MPSRPNARRARRRSVSAARCSSRARRTRARIKSSSPLVRNPAAPHSSREMRAAQRQPTCPTPRVARNRCRRARRSRVRSARTLGVPTASLCTFPLTQSPIEAPSDSSQNAAASALNSLRLDHGAREGLKWTQRSHPVTHGGSDSRTQFESEGTCRVRPQPSALEHTAALDSPKATRSESRSAWSQRSRTRLRPPRFPRPPSVGTRCVPQRLRRCRHALLDPSTSIRPRQVVSETPPLRRRRERYRPAGGSEHPSGLRRRRPGHLQDRNTTRPRPA